jgi:hypothetical protein
LQNNYQEKIYIETFSDGFHVGAQFYADFTGGSGHVANQLPETNQVAKGQGHAV